MKWIDIPPVWLVAFIAVAYSLRGALGLTLDFARLDLLGGMLIGGGILLMVLAVLAMAQARTTVVPHMMPDALVSGGIFGISRNPIYLGDAMVLAGLILYWGAALALPLIPVFVWVIEKRFIIAEEGRLSSAFGAEFEAYCSRTRRWI